MRVVINHPELGPQDTYLTAAVVAAATSSTVKNYDGFAAADYILFGNYGEEGTEVVLLTSVTANVTLGHTTGPVFAHAINTAIYQIPYNQVEVSFCATKTGTYAVLTTIALDVDQRETVYVDTAGTSATWYKVRYKNSNSGTYSSYSAPIQGTGWLSDSLGGITEAVLEEVGDVDSLVFEKGRIKRLANTAVRNMTVAALKQHTPVLISYDTKTLTASTQAYDLPSDFLSFRKVDIAYDGSNYRRCRFEDESEGLPDTDYYTSDPRVFRRGSQYGFRPYTVITGSSVAALWYHAYPDAMADEDDETGLPYGAEDMIIPFVIYRLLLGKNEDRATSYRREYEDAKTNWLEAISANFQDYQLNALRIRTDSDLYDSEYVDY